MQKEKCKHTKAIGSNANIGQTEALQFNQTATKHCKVSNQVVQQTALQQNMTTLQSKAPIILHCKPNCQTKQTAQAATIAKKLH